MDYDNLESINIGEHLCLIDDTSARAIKGVLSDILKLGNSICIGHFRTSALLEYDFSEKGIWLKTKNNQYRLIVEENPADKILGEGSVLTLVKVLLNKSTSQNSILPGEGFTGTLEENMSIGRQITLKINDDSLVSTSTLVKTYSVRKKLKLLQTVTSIYEVFIH